jgi:hypothetical protein
MPCITKFIPFKLFAGSATECAFLHFQSSPCGVQERNRGCEGQCVWILCIIHMGCVPSRAGPKKLFRVAIRVRNLSLLINRCKIVGFTDHDKLYYRDDAYFKCNIRRAQTTIEILTATPTSKAPIPNLEQLVTVRSSRFSMQPSYMTDPPAPVPNPVVIDPPPNVRTSQIDLNSEYHRTITYQTECVANPCICIIFHYPCTFISMTYTLS